MKNIFASILLFFSAIIKRIPEKNKPITTAPCSFCGETTHTSDDCPNAAKFKLFDVDQE